MDNHDDFRYFQYVRASNRSITIMLRCELVEARIPYVTKDDPMIWGYIARNVRTGAYDIFLNRPIETHFSLKNKFNLNHVPYETFYLDDQQARNLDLRSRQPSRYELRTPFLGYGRAAASGRQTRLPVRVVARVRGQRNPAA